MNRRIVLSSLVGLIVAVLMGCAAAPRQVYPGPRLSADQEARIVTDSENEFGSVVPSLDRKIYLVEINGLSLQDTQAMLLNGQRHAHPTEAYVKPGRQELEVRYVHFNTFAEGRIWFDAEAGHTYRVRYRIAGYAIRFHVEDAANGKVVGGILE